MLQQLCATFFINILLHTSIISSLSAQTILSNVSQICLGLSDKHVDPSVKAKILPDQTVYMRPAITANSWRTVNELLHADTTDRYRADAENSALCCLFAGYYVSEIADLKSSIVAKLCAMPNLPAFSDPHHFCLLMSEISPVSSANIHRILTASPAKASSADFIPPSIIKACLDFFSELIAQLANHSFHEGIFLHVSSTPKLFLSFRNLFLINSFSNLVTINVAGCRVPLADQIKILGVTLDTNLSVDNHVNCCQQIYSLQYPSFTAYPSLHI